MFIFAYRSCKNLRRLSPGKVGNVRLRGQQGVAQALPVLPRPVQAGDGGSHAREGLYSILPLSR